MAQQIITSRSLSMKLDRHASRVLKAHLRPLPRVRGQHQKYEVIELLPSKAEYEKMKRLFYTYGAAQLFADCQQGLSDLREELETWAESIPESFRETNQALPMLEDAISEIESCESGNSFAEMPDHFQTQTIVFIPPLETSSRRERCGVITDCLSCLIAELSTDGLEGEELEDAEMFLSDLQEVVDTLEGIEFPSMIP